MLLAADAGTAVAPAMPIAIAAMPTGAASFLTFTVKPSCVEPVSTADATPPHQDRNAKLLRSVSAGQLRRDFILSIISLIGPKLRGGFRATPMESRCLRNSPRCRR